MLQAQTKPRTRGVRQRQVRPQQQGQGIVDPGLPHIRLLPPVQPAGAAPTHAGGLKQAMSFQCDLEQICLQVFFSGAQLQVGCQECNRAKCCKVASLAVKPNSCVELVHSMVSVSACCGRAAAQTCRLQVQSAVKHLVSHAFGKQRPPLKLCAGLACGQDQLVLGNMPGA